MQWINLNCILPVVASGENVVISAGGTRTQADPEPGLSQTAFSKLAASELALFRLVLWLLFLLSCFYKLMQEKLFLSIKCILLPDFLKCL